MDALPTRPAIDRERLTLGVCMLDNRSGIFWLVSPTGQVYRPDRVLLDSAAESYDVLVGGAVLYPMGFQMDYWTEVATYRPGWQSGDGRMSQVLVRFISGVRPRGSPPKVLASVAGFSGVVTWPGDLLEGNISAIDTSVYKDIEE
ncbi:unnamed protein product, partial [Sphagnum compactum]